LTQSDAEKLYEKHRAALERGTSSADLAALDEDLSKMLADEQRDRTLNKVVGWASLPIFIATGVVGVWLGNYNARSPTESATLKATGDTIFVLGAIGLQASIGALLEGYFTESPTEAMLRSWQTEPSRSRLNMKPSAFVTPQGGGLSLTGTF
jgi:hypothetical protein